MSLQGQSVSVLQVPFNWFLFVQTTNIFQSSFIRNALLEVAEMSQKNDNNYTCHDYRLRKVSARFRNAKELHQQKLEDYHKGVEHYHSDSSWPLDGPPIQIAWQQTTIRESTGIFAYPGMTIDCEPGEDVGRKKKAS